MRTKVEENFNQEQKNGICVVCLRTGNMAGMENSCGDKDSLGQGEQMMWIVKASRAVFLSPTPSVVVKSDCGCCHLFVFSSPPPPCSSKRQTEKNSLCSFSELARGDALGWVQVFRPGLQTSAHEFFGAAQLYPRPPSGGE